MNGSTLMYCRSGGAPFVSGMKPARERQPDARVNAAGPSSASEGDDRPAAGLRLERADPEVLLAGQQRDRCALIQVPHLLVGPSPQKLSPGAGETLEPRPLGPRADDLQGHAGQPARLDRDVD